MGSTELLAAFFTAAAAFAASATAAAAAAAIFRRFGLRLVRGGRDTTITTFTGGQVGRNDAV